LLALIERDRSPDKALSYANRSLAALEQIPATVGHARFAAQLLTFSLLLILDKYAAARDVLDRTSAAVRTLPKELHAQLEPTLLDMEGALHYARKEWTRAVECWEMALSMRQARFGALARETILPCFNLGRAFSHTGKLTEADENHGRARILFNNKLVMDGTIESLVAQYSFLPDIFIVPPKLLATLLR